MTVRVNHQCLQPPSILRHGQNRGDDDGWGGCVYISPHLPSILKYSSTSILPQATTPKYHQTSYQTSNDQRFLNMKTSFIACLALANSFAFAAPAVDSALVDRATVSPYYAPSLAILTNLYSEVRQYTAVMSTPISRLLLLTVDTKS